MRKTYKTRVPVEMYNEIYRPVIDSMMKMPNAKKKMPGGFMFTSVLGKNRWVEIMFKARDKTMRMFQTRVGFMYLHQRKK